jgi:uncharacterized cupredoxin-like copper-binding protein
MLRLPCWLIASVALLLALLAACGGEQAGRPTPTPARPENGVLVLHAAEWRFEPSRIVLHQDEQVRIELQNDGKILHDFKIDKLEADVAESSSTGPLSAGKSELFVGADVGKSGTLVFTPKETGTFTFYCTVPQHRQLGMKGTLIVE